MTSHRADDGRPSVDRHRATVWTTATRCLFALLLLLVAMPSAQARAQDPIGAPTAEAGSTLDDELLEPFRFRLIGPANQAGRVTAIAVPAGSGGKTAYVGFAGGGVWKTVNHGITWRPIFDDQAFTSIGDVAVAESDDDVVWVGTGERNSLRSNSWGNGVYRSTDGGRSWDHMGLDETREIGRIVIHPEDPSTVWVAAMGHLWGTNPERGVYKTTDGGETWDQVLFVNDTTGFVDLKMDPSDPDVLYAAGWHRVRWGGGRMEGAGAGSGIWKTTDGGRNWTRLTDPARGTGLPDGKLGRIGLGISASNPDRVYAVIQDASSAFSSSVSISGGVYRSDDAGASWAQVHDVSAVPDYYYNEVWTDPNDADRAYLAGTFMALTEDGGRTFENVQLGRVHVDHHALWIDPADSDHMILGNDGGIYLSWDKGENWEHVSLPVGQFYEVDLDTTKVPYHVCGGLQDNGTWCGPTRTRETVGITNHDWYSIYGGDGFVSAVSVDSPQIRYAESQYGNIGRRNTETWETVSLQPHSEDAGWLSGYEFRWDWNTPFIVSHHDPSTLYLGGNHLFRLNERGRSWDVLGPDMTRGNRFAPEPDSTYTSYRSLHSVAESLLDRRILWTGSNDGLIWVSRDAGETWRNVTDNLPDQEPLRCFVAEIEPSRHEADRAYVVHDCHRRDDYRPYVYRTDDAGSTWTRISDGLPEDAGSWVVRESPTNPDVLFVGNERGVYFTMDGGRGWTRLENGLPTVGVRDLEIATGANDLVVGTFGRSVYVLDISALQELSPTLLSEPAHLFPVEDGRVYNRIGTYASFGDQFFTASNPPYGVTMTYYLRDDEGEDVTLTVRKLDEAEGPGLRTGDQPEPEERDRGDDPDLVPAPEGEDQDSAATRGSVVARISGDGRPGMHQVTWDLETMRPRPRELGGPTSRGDLSEAEAGLYEVSLRAGGQTMRRTFRVERGWRQEMPGAVR